jgi:hypothetical protein
MATEILRAYGWECGNTMLSSVDSGSASVSGTRKTGSYGLFFPGSSGGTVTRWARFPYIITQAKPSVSVWAQNNSSFNINNSMRIRFLCDTGEYIELIWNSATHTMDAYIDNVLVDSGSVGLSTADWFHIQFYVDIAASGSISVKINGHESIDYSGDTRPDPATTGTTYVYLYSTLTPLPAKNAYFDDLVIGSGGYLGDLRCVDIRPNADGTVQYTPSTGSDNYAMVDETPPSDSDYNETDVDGNADELDMTDFDGATYIPRAVTAWVRARQDAGVGDSIQVGVDSGGTDDMSAAQALSDSFEYFFHTLDDNPADAAEWEDADIDALKLRYEAVIP